MTKLQNEEYLSTPHLEGAKEHNYCIHCKELCEEEVWEQDKVFCCFGCRAVYQILAKNQLTSEYSKLPTTEDSIFNASPINKLKRNDNPYLHLDQREDLDGKVTLFIEGMSCINCIWLFNKLPFIIKGVNYCKTKLAQNTVTISYNSSEVLLSDILLTIRQFGYLPYPILEKEEITYKKSAYNKKELTKLGIAAFCSGNIMFLSISNYAGASSDHLKLFNIISFFLCLPVVTYCASNFYQSSLKSIKTKKVSIDLPFSIAISLAFIISSKNLMSGSDIVYFDTIATLVFLISLTRYILAQITTKVLSHIEDDTPLGVTQVEVRKGDTISQVSSDQVQIDDTILIKKGDIIPVDALITKGSSFVNTSILTGEVLPREVSENDKVLAGYLNNTNNIEIKAISTIYESEVSLMIERIKSSTTSSIKMTSFGEVYASYFALFTLSIATVSFLTFAYLGNIDKAFSIALGLIIISCPCALGLATPLAFIKAMKACKEKGLIIKDQMTLEKASNIDSVFSDKTGTLTTSSIELKNIEYYKELSKAQTKILEKLVVNSTHPLCLVISNHLKLNSKELRADTSFNFSEVPGQGISTRIGTQDYFLGKVEGIESSYPQIGLYFIEADGKELAIRFEFFDEVYRSAFELSSFLKQASIPFTILSGDNKTSVLRVSKALGLDEDSVRSNLSPVDKYSIIEKENKALFIGDGANDALSLSRSYVGVAVKGSLPITMKYCGIYSANKGLTPVIDLIRISKGMKELIYRNLTFSAIFNILGITLVFTEVITPLVAAVLMPASSLVVILSSASFRINKE